MHWFFRSIRLSVSLRAELSIKDTSEKESKKPFTWNLNIYTKLFMSERLREHKILGSDILHLELDLKTILIAGQSLSKRKINREYDNN